MQLRSAAWFEGRLDTTFQHRSSLRAIGHLPASYVGKPIIGIANSWNDFNNCNAPHKELVEHVKRGVLLAGGYPMEFHTISTPADLMKPSDLPYRNLMSMDVEEMARSLPIDGLVLLCECDKTCPAQLMAAASLDLPALQLAAGHRGTAYFRGEVVNYGTDFWRYLDDYKAGLLSEAEWSELEGCISCTAGGCPVMGTASSMKSMSEMLGMMLPGTSSIPATHASRIVAAERTGRRVVDMVQEDLRPSRLMTEAAFRNAIRLLTALGGSTNAVLHLIAIAGRRGIELPLESFDRLGREVPVLVNLQPSGPHNMDEFFAAGGLAATIRELLPLLEDDCLTAMGRTVQEVYGEVAPSCARDVIRGLDEPFKVDAGLVVLRGNLAPDGAVLKQSASSFALQRHTGPALVFADYEDMIERIDRDDLKVTPDSVLVMKNCGPVGAGFPEWGSIPIPAKLLRSGVRDMVRISDGRMSGTSYGTCILHTAPESAIGGVLAVVEDGDLIELDVERRALELKVSPDEIVARLAAWRPPQSPHRRGFFHLYEQEVLQAPLGCDFNSLRPRDKSEVGLVPPVIGRG